MKTSMTKICCIAALLASAGIASASLYTDATGDEISGSGILDIVSVDVQNNATDITFTLNLAGDPVAADWGKFMVAVDSVAGGDTVGNAWARPISMASGMDYFVGIWTDWGAGSEIQSWDGAAWGFEDNGLVSVDTSSVTITATLASIGLTPGDSFVFDVFSSGGGADGAIDALSDPNQTIPGWGDSYTSTSTLSYTTVIPEPATLGLVGLASGALLFIRRRFMI